MTKTDKRKWVAALRSGEFKQGRSWLRSQVDGEDRFCCLGVACEVFGMRYRSGCYGASDVALPRKLQRRLGLSYDPQVMVDGSRIGLATLNDTGWSFAKIADLIEEQL